jgi:hypothetical protein
LLEALPGDAPPHASITIEPDPHAEGIFDEAA